MEAGLAHTRVDSKYPEVQKWMVGQARVILQCNRTLGGVFGGFGDLYMTCSARAAKSLPRASRVPKRRPDGHFQYYAKGCKQLSWAGQRRMAEIMGQRRITEIMASASPQSLVFAF